MTEADIIAEQINGLVSIWLICRANQWTGFYMIDLPSKSMDWFLYDIGLHHERVKILTKNYIQKILKLHVFHWTTCRKNGSRWKHAEWEQDFAWRMDACKVLIPAPSHLSRSEVKSLVGERAISSVFIWLGCVFPSLRYIKCIFCDWYLFWM